MSATILQFRPRVAPRSPTIDYRDAVLQIIEFEKQRRAGATRCPARCQAFPAPP